MSRPSAVRVSLFGAPGSDFNLGVAALRESAVAGLFRRAPDADLSVFDDGWGIRTAEIDVDGVSHSFRLCGVRNSRRIHRRESYVNMRMSALLGGFGNPGLGIIDRSDVV